MRKVALALALAAACAGSDPAAPEAPSLEGAWEMNAGGCLGYLALDHGSGPWGGSWVCTEDGRTAEDFTWAGYVFGWSCSDDGTVTLDMGVFTVAGTCDENRIAGTVATRWIGWMDARPFVATRVGR